MKLNYESVGDYALAQAEGTPEEIAALVSLLQERQADRHTPLDAMKEAVQKTLRQELGVKERW